MASNTWPPSLFRASDGSPPTLHSLRHDIDRLFASFMQNLNISMPAEGGADFFPSLDIREDDKQIALSLELAGVGRDDVELTIADRILTVSGHKRSEVVGELSRKEASYGSFFRSVRLPFDIQADKVDAKLDKGCSRSPFPSPPASKQQATRLRSRNESRKAGPKRAGRFSPDDFVGLLLQGSACVHSVTNRYQTTPKRVHGCNMRSARSLHQSGSNIMQISTGSFSTFSFADIGSNDALEDVFLGQQLETFKAGRTLFWEGDRADHVFQLTSGMVRLYRILADGRRVIVGFMFAGELLGLSFQHGYLYTVEAVNDVRVRRVTAAGFRAAVDNSPRLRPKLLAKLQDEMCAAQDQMLLLLHHSAEQRVAAFLLLVGRKTLGSVVAGALIKLDLSRADIADYLSLTVETVSRCISRLRADGIVTMDGPVRLTIVKPQRLRDLSGEAESWADDDEPLRVKKTA